MKVINISVKKYTLEDRLTWNAFIKTSKNGTFILDRNFMEYHSHRFVDSSLMFYDEKGKVVALLPANIGGNILYSHQGLTYGGMVTNKKMKVSIMIDVFESLKLFAKENGIEKIIYKSIPRIYQSILADEDEYALFRIDAKRFRCDVSTCVDLQSEYKFSDLRTRMIKKAAKESVAVEESKDFKAYIKLLNYVLEKQHGESAVHTAKEISMLTKQFPENIKLYIAKKDGEMIGGTLVFIKGDVVHTQYLANNDIGREFGGLDLVINHLIKEAYKDKKYFDLGISTEKQGRFLNEGLIAQKEGFSGRAVCHYQYEIKI